MRKQIRYSQQSNETSLHNTFQSVHSKIIVNHVSHCFFTCCVNRAVQEDSFVKNSFVRQPIILWCYNILPAIILSSFKAEVQKGQDLTSVFVIFYFFLPICNGQFPYAALLVTANSHCWPGDSQLLFIKVKAAPRGNGALQCYKNSVLVKL